MSDRSSDAFWTCTGCGQDLRMYDTYDYCRTAIVYYGNFTTNPDGALTYTLSDGHVQYDDEDECETRCVNCATPVNTAQYNAIYDLKQQS